MTFSSRTYETLKLTLDDHVARLELCRPMLLNRIDEPAHLELIHIFREIAEHKTVRAVLWTAQGKAFSAGGDLSIIHKQNEDSQVRAEIFRQALDIVHSLLNIHVPVVVALHGDVYGLGANLVLCCDAIVAARTAKIADTHVRVGLVAGDGGCVVWPSAMGMVRAKRHLLTGKPVRAEDAYAWGLVSDLADSPDECRAQAEAIVREIVSLPPIAVQGTKRSLSAVLRARANEVLETSLLHEMGSIASSDMLEAVKAFMEKRPGVYHGR